MIGIYRPSSELEKYNPHIIFIFDDTRDVTEYRKYLFELIVNFFIFCNPQKNKVTPEKVFHWNDRSTIEGIYIHDKRIDSCEMFLCDGLGGPEAMNEWRPCRGVRFFGDADWQSRDASLKKVFLVADAFEEYLKIHGVYFRRRNSTVL